MDVSSLLQYLEDLSICGRASHPYGLQLPDEGCLGEAGWGSGHVLHGDNAALWCGEWMRVEGDEGVRREGGWDEEERRGSAD